MNQKSHLVGSISRVILAHNSVHPDVDANRSEPAESGPDLDAQV